LAYVSYRVSPIWRGTKDADTFLAESDVNMVC
jgi:hypothetical protein